MPIYYFFSLSLLLLSITIAAQTHEPLWEQIPNAQPGKCYARCYIPDQYNIVTEEILFRKEHTSYQIVPAVYDTVLLTIIEKPAYTTLQLQPAIFEVETLSMRISDTLSKWHYIPPHFEMVTEQVLVQAATLVWTKQIAASNCLNSHDKEACYVWCLVEQPAQYRTIQRQVLKTPAKLELEQVLPRYLTLQRAIVKQVARVDTQHIAAQTRQINTLQLRSPATKVAVEIPTQYAAVTCKQLIKAAYFTPYMEVVCDSRHPSPIKGLQKALRARGYNIPLDNVFGPDTRKALIDFQKKNNLPVGKLYPDVLRLLGVE